MPSANATSLPLNSLPLKPEDGGSAWQLLRKFLGRFLLRLVRPGRWDAPALPDDLARDVGLGERLPADRSDAYWNDKPRSRLKDLPF